MTQPSLRHKRHFDWPILTIIMISSIYSSSALTSSLAMRAFSKPALARVAMSYSSLSSDPTNTGGTVRFPSRYFWRRELQCSLSSLLSLSSSSSSLSIRLFSASGDDAATRDNKARILFLGTPDVAATSLKTIVEASKQENCNFEVVGVVTQPPRKRGRRGKLTASPVGAVAEELGITVLCPEKAKDTAFLDELEHSVKPDMCITAAYGQYLPKRFLAIPKYGTLNIHPSLLPRWRGASPVQRSLEAGDDPLGVSVLFTVSKMDAGPIVSQRTVAYSENDQATTVLPDLFAVGTACLLEEALPNVLAGAVTMDRGSTPQDDDDERITAASLIDAAEAELRVWEQTARDLHNKVRGFAMWPGTFMYVRLGDDHDDHDDDPSPAVKVKIVETRVAGDPGSADPTDLMEIPRQKGAGLMVVCHDGSVLEVVRIQPLTKKVMDAKSFVNGLRGKTIRWTHSPVEEAES